MGILLKMVARISSGKWVNVISVLSRVGFSSDVIEIGLSRFIINIALVNLRLERLQ